MVRIINHTSLKNVLDEMVRRMITAAVDAYEAVFEAPSCDVEITVCRGKSEFQRLVVKHTGEENKDTIRDYDGGFLCPQKKDDPFRILVLLKKEAVAGAERYFAECDHGSMRDADLSREERESRGVELMGYIRFVEMLQHEYSHLCSFEKLMLATGWEDPAIGRHSMDYHLYDERIARYRGTYAMLCMFDDYMEINLFYSIWRGHSLDLHASYQSEAGVMRDFLNQEWEAIEDSLREQMELYGKTGEQMVAELEEELRHKLCHGGMVQEDGVPVLSLEEVAEFLLFDDFGEDEIADYTFRAVIPILYYARNQHATYQGAQIAGHVHAVYDYLEKVTNTAGYDGVGKRELGLANLLDTPYYEAAANDETDVELDRFEDQFQKLRRQRR